MSIRSHLPQVFSTNGKRQVQEIAIGVRYRKELKILSDSSDGSFLGVVRDEIPVYVKRLSAATFLPLILLFLNLLSTLAYYRKLTLLTLNFPLPLPHGEIDTK